MTVLTKKDGKAAAVDNHDAIPAKNLWLDPIVIGVIIMSTMSYWIVGMSATWLPPFLQQGLGYSQGEIGYIISTVYIFQCPLLLLGSWVAQRMLQRGVSKRSGLEAPPAMPFSSAALSSSDRSMLPGSCSSPSLHCLCSTKPDHDLRTYHAWRRSTRRSAPSSDRHRRIWPMDDDAG
ncbi:hypothetical protein [Agrobacterium larrymoorei]|uniref:hypothetical protein n=1 Tax=Agrobacterium larrymoorei TaxID=160699 RepID=UPI0004B886BD|nr:hypothetical protein [Agrobacterium larrymoorei]